MPARRRAAGRPAAAAPGGTRGAVPPAAAAGPHAAGAGAGQAAAAGGRAGSTGSSGGGRCVRRPPALCRSSPRLLSSSGGGRRPARCGCGAQPGQRCASAPPVLAPRTAGGAAGCLVVNTRHSEHPFFDFLLTLLTALLTPPVSSPLDALLPAPICLLCGILTTGAGRQRQGRMRAGGAVEYAGHNRLGRSTAADGGRPSGQAGQGRVACMHGKHCCLSWHILWVFERATHECPRCLITGGRARAPQPDGGGAGGWGRAPGTPLAMLENASGGAVVSAAWAGCSGAGGEARGRGWRSSGWGGMLATA